MNDTKPILELLIGLPSSGKSTYATEKATKYRHIFIVSRDSIREMLVGDYSKFPFGKSYAEDIVTDIVFYSTTELLENGFSVILDETNLNKDRRNSFVSSVQQAVSHEIDIIYNQDFLDVPLEECIRRDKERDKTVGEQVITGMWKKYIEPYE